jgi:hypothetical protein
MSSEVETSLTVDLGAMIEALRQRPRSSFKSLINATPKKLQDLPYNQSPQLVGPTSVVKRRIPGGSMPHRKTRQEMVRSSDYLFLSCRAKSRHLSLSI